MAAVGLSMPESLRPASLYIVPPPCAPTSVLPIHPGHYFRHCFTPLSTCSFKSCFDGSFATEMSHIHMQTLSNPSAHVEVLSHFSRPHPCSLTYSFFLLLCCTIPLVLSLSRRSLFIVHCSSSPSSSCTAARTMVGWACGWRRGVLLSENPCESLFLSFSFCARNATCGT